MAITFVGTGANSVENVTNSFLIGGTSVGDLVILGIGSFDVVTGKALSSITGLGATWNLIVTDTAQDTGSLTRYRYSALYYGIVVTPSATTVTVTMNGTTANNRGFPVMYSVFRSAGTWAIDSHGFTDGVADGLAASGNFPSLTPAGSPELYFGLAYVQATTVTMGGTGFTTLSGATGSQGATYSLNAPSPSSPTWSQGTVESYVTLACLMKVTVAVTNQIVMIL